MAGLLTRLELAGFQLSPAEKLRLLQVISGPASAHWREPQKLRYLLAPIIAKSKAEQERFYHIFDQYYAELLAEATEPDQAEDRFLWLKKIRAWLRRWWWTLPLALTLGLMVWLLLSRWPTPGSKITSIGFSLASSPVRVGDTAQLSLNTRNIDTVEAQIRWQLLDKKSGHIEAEKVGSVHWQLPFATLQGNPEKTVRVEVHEKRRDSIFSYQGDLRIECLHPPQLERLDLPINLPPGESFTFVPNVIDESSDLQYYWDFGDNQHSTQRSPKHSYEQEGSYTVELTVTRPGLSGFCSTSTSTILRVGEDQVFLPYYDLQYDPIRTRATFGWALWVVTLLLGMGTFYSIFRWARTQRPVLPTPEKGQQRGLPLQSSDRPPYEIPFRSLNGLIRNLSGQFRLADALRRRQEGLRQEVDVPKTLNATIEGGGFPSLRFRSTTRPADYLFLVDEQNENSHQGRLLRHLVKVLYDQDVHAEVFYYRSEFFHFWNPQYPQGITLEQISRLCPEHRLVVFGDAHALLDPYAQGSQSLRHNAVADFQRWKQRLLLTPRPPQSWDYRETSIHGLLPVFPSDLAGQMAAANFVDNGMAPEDLPGTFTAWRDRLVGTRNEPDVNRRWRDAIDHADYLGYGSDLYRWFCALALYPTPTWEITLAIGTALGVPLNVDNLLILARIPSLQEGKINPRLRKDLLEDLEEYDEELAREAIAGELEASLAEAAPGFAHRALQSNLAVQRFALAPFSTESQTQVKVLLEKGWFNRLQIEDMGGLAAKKMAPARRASRMTKGGFSEQAPEIESPFENVNFNSNIAQQSNIPNYNRPEPELKADEPTLRRFLQDYGEQVQQEAPVVEQPIKPKTINREFWQMVAFALFALALIFGMMLLDSSETLYRWAFGGKPALKTYNPEEKLKGNIFVKEAFYIDSAAILNNQAVQLYREQAFEELQKIASASRVGPQTYTYPPRVRQLLEQALKTNRDHVSAALNLARLDYNLGVTLYRSARNGGLQNPDSLALTIFEQMSQLGNYFQGSQVPSGSKNAFAQLELAGQHARGVIFYLINSTQDPVLAEQVYQNLLDAGFFDTTSIRPNLATLLQKEPSRIYGIFPGTDTENGLQVQISYYTNPNRDPSLRLRLSAVERQNGGRGGTIATYVPRLDRQAQSRNGNERLTLQANLSKPGDQRRTDSLRVELVRINPNPRDIVVVAKQSIPYRKTWGKPATPPDEGQQVQMNGTLVDASSGQALNVRASVDWRWLYRDGRKIGGQTSTFSRYIIRGDLSRVTGLEVRISAQGYQPEALSFTLAELQRMNERLPELRLKSTAQQNLDTRQQQQQQQSEHRENSKWYNPSLPDMARVNGGTFTMGCIDEQDKDCSPAEKPPHEVRLNDYLIGKYEVTNAEFAIFLNDIQDNPTRSLYPSESIEEHPWGLQRITGNVTMQWMPAKGYEKHPVVEVSWNWAKAYCDWLSRKTGQKYRLPTEAEWEYAAQGGQNVSKKRFLFSGSDQIGEVAWYLENAKNTHVVGQKSPNLLGIYDMSGNVYEWCQDWYGQYGAGKQNNPVGPAYGQQKVMRGGSFGMFEETLYLTERAQNFPNLSNQNLGFRVVRTL